MGIYPRSDRVAELIHRELALLLRQKAQDPRFKEITLTHVDVSADLKSARIFVLLPDDSGKAGLIKAINKATGFFRHELAHALNLRTTPTLNFVYDDSISRAEYLMKLIDTANDENEAN